MAPDDFIQSLQEIRAEVQVLYAMHCMARVELDLYVQSIFGLIDSQVDVAMRGNISNLIQTAKEMNREVLELNRQRGRYFGVVLDLNTTGILIASRTNAAIVIPLSDIDDLSQGLKAGDQIGADYVDGRCEIRVRA
ncbi:hypothetical protein [Ralstonia flatus]|uniref:Uncharacterized protein n=1 Tax=Ralstonia flatus TaxID=3058601 RepID=A0AAD2C984_9RALS|nr:hypothetical protein [Ralstonia sp. LMG 32965]CAJ0881361.1 hypothetical protein R77567_03381 [Ralstonia sp. LMG 32965]CAJ0893054.1 hypothetical protein R77564_03680 [Ralstonia sp. LMG 32965]